MKNLCNHFLESAVIKRRMNGGHSMDTHKGVLVCGEIAEGKLAPVT